MRSHTAELETFITGDMRAKWNYSRPQDNSIHSSHHICLYSPSVCISSFYYEGISIRKILYRTEKKRFIIVFGNFRSATRVDQSTRDSCTAKIPASLAKKHYTYLMLFTRAICGILLNKQNEMQRNTSNFNRLNLYFLFSLLIKYYYFSHSFEVFLCVLCKRFVIHWKH